MNLQSEFLTVVSISKGPKKIKKKTWLFDAKKLATSPSLDEILPIDFKGTQPWTIDNGIKMKNFILFEPAQRMNTGICQQF